MANTYLTRTMGSATSRTKFTVSVWLKKSTINSTDNDEKHFFNGFLSSNYRFMIYMTSSDQLKIRNVDNNTENVSYVSNARYRDASSWYHVVVRIDSSQAGGNRIRAYVNGEQITSWASSTEPNQGADFALGTSSYTCNIGRYGGGAHYWNGGMSHYHYCDGQSYDASAFGSTDSTTGEWKINTSPSVTYGNEGFFMFKDDNSLSDDSGNNNNFTLSGGTLTKTEDNPSNVFCTWNPNYRSARKDMTLTNGNTFIFEQNSGDSGVSGTIAVSSGKWYWEQKIAQVNGTNAAVAGAMHSVEDWNETPTEVYGNNNTFGIRSNGKAYKNGNDLGTVTAATYNNDVLGIAFDADNGNMYLWRNGAAQNSGNAIITGIDMTKTWVPFAVQHGGARVSTSTNFGNGYFQTTAVSSAGTNASNNGIFEYDVPSGYTALSTKGLNL